MKALAVVLAAAALVLAACSGSSSTPGVASLTPSSGSTASSDGNPATAPASGNPTQTLDEWAACIRKHGAPNQSDPTIDSNKDIEITMNNVSETLQHEVHGSTGPCSNYLLTAENELRGGQPSPTDNPAQDARFNDCMRANGVPNWPDSGSFEGTGVDPNSPAVQDTMKLCDHKVGMRYYAPGTEEPGVVIESGCNAPPGMQCPKLPPGGNGGGNRPVTSPPSGSGGNG